MAGHGGANLGAGVGPEGAAVSEDASQLQALLSKQVRIGDFAEVLDLLIRGADPSQLDADGWTAAGLVRESGSQHYARPPQHSRRTARR